MTLLAPIRENDSLQSQVAWATTMAFAAGEELIFLVFLKSFEENAEENLKKIDCQALKKENAKIATLVENLKNVGAKFEGESISLPAKGEGEDPILVSVYISVGKESERAIGELSAKTPVSRVLIGKEDKRNLEHYVRALSSRITGEIVFVRSGEKPQESIQKILVPVSSGPNARSAIGLALTLVRAQKGSVTAVFIEPNIGHLAEEVGMKVLEKQLHGIEIPEGASLEKKVVLSDSVQDGILTEVQNDYDLLMLGFSEVGALRRNLFGTLSQKLLQVDSEVGIVLVKSKKPVLTRVKHRLENYLDLVVPQLERENRVQLVETLQSGSVWNFDFFSLISLSTAIAALGLIQSSAAVVIGAMLVAPLMTPLLGAGLSVAQGNLSLVQACARSVSFGFITALLVGGFVAFLSGGEMTAELLARGEPNLLDLTVAFLSGLAAAYCSARPGLSAALPGVAIAAALVPPIATVGVSFVFGDFGNAKGAALLFSVNVVAIILGAALCFHALGIRGGRSVERDITWARRFIVALFLVLVFLTVPLGSYFSSKVQELSIRPQVVKSIKETALPLIEVEAGALTGVSYGKNDLGGISYRLKTELPVVPNSSFLQELRAKVGEKIDPTDSLELEIVLVQK